MTDVESRPAGDVSPEVLERLGLSKGTLSFVDMKDEPLFVADPLPDISPYSIRWTNMRGTSVARVFFTVEDADGTRHDIPIADFEGLSRQKYGPRRMPASTWKQRRQGRRYELPQCTIDLFYRLAVEREEREYEDITGIRLAEASDNESTPPRPPLPLETCPSCGRRFLTPQQKIVHVRERCGK